MCDAGKLRIGNPYFLQDDLVERTGVRGVDEFLFSLVNILQIALGGRLRCILVIGSYAHGGYTRDSDIDLCVVWKDGSSPEDRRRGDSLVEHFARGRGYQVDPMYGLPETPLYDPEALMFTFFAESQTVEIPCGPLLKLAMKQHSILLWGEDIRGDIKLPADDEAVLRDVLAAPLNWIRTTHYDSHGARIEPPLSDPPPGTDDRGYGDLHRVAIFVLHLARALVFLETGEFLFDKRAVPDAFERHYGEPWASLVRGVHAARQGQLPEAERNAAYAHGCQSLTDFQNYFLQRIAAQGIDVGAVNG